jgi:hypothetical protein
VTGVDDDPSPAVELDEVELVVAVLAVCEVAVVPGMVDALTAPSTPTPASAPTATPVVSRLSRRKAASRARILSWVLLSTGAVLPRPLKRLLEEAEMLLRTVKPSRIPHSPINAGFGQFGNPAFEVKRGLPLTK